MVRKPPNSSNRQNRLSEKTFLKKFSPTILIILAIVGGLIGSFGFYLSQQKEIWEGRLNQAKEQLDERQNQIDILKKELVKVKQDLNDYVVKDPNLPVAPPTGKQVAEISDKAFEFTLTKSKPIKVLSNMTMEITSLDFKSNPDRYTVSARVVYEGFPAMTIGDAEVEYKVKYPSEGGVEIQVLKITPVYATFSIIKSQDPPAK